MQKKSRAAVSSGIVIALAATGFAVARADSSWRVGHVILEPTRAIRAELAQAEARERIQMLNRRQAQLVRTELPESEKTPDAAQEYARRFMLKKYGWGADQYRALITLWIKESDWDYRATNPTSGAYGIPQALPADKLASFGDDWRTNPRTQIRWGLDYIASSYGTPAGALSFHLANNWY